MTGKEASEATTPWAGTSTAAAARRRFVAVLLAVATSVALLLATAGAASASMLEPLEGSSYPVGTSLGTLGGSLTGWGNPYMGLVSSALYQQYGGGMLGQCNWGMYQCTSGGMLQADLY